MITISFAPHPVGSTGGSGPTTEADAAGFGSVMGAVAGQPSGISFMPLIATGPGTLTANPGLPQGLLVASQPPQTQLPTNSPPSPFGSGPLSNSFAGLIESPSRSDPLVQAQRAAVADRMNGLREIFAAALARDQAIRPVQQTIGGAVQAAGDRRAANEAALAPAIPVTPTQDAVPVQPGVIEMVGSPVAVDDAEISLPDEQYPAQNIADAIQSELDKASAERSISELMKNELEKAQADRPIVATVNIDLENAKEDRPIEQNMLGSLVAGMDELELSEEAEQRLIETVAGEDGTLDPETQKELLENATVMLQEKYQAIIDSFTERVGRTTAKEPAGEIA